jgi:ribonuclease HI
MKLNIYTDGGARGNPGPAGVGVVIKNEVEETIISFGEYIGEQTNNFAEYSALIAGLKKAVELNADEVVCHLDSELVTKQMRQEYKVREITLQKLFVQAYNLTQKLKKVSFVHIYREKNQEADKLVNKAIDSVLSSL